MVSTADLVPLSYLILRFLSRGENKLQTNSKQERQKRVKEMAVTKNWFNLVRRKFIRHSHRDITILHSPRPSDEAFIREEILISESRDASAAPAQFLTQEDIAAIKIQAVFRGHLARQAFRALKSLVKLQALVRGSYVRAQSRLALHCMHALTRLQVRVRARQLLSQYGDD